MGQASNIFRSAGLPSFLVMAFMFYKVVFKSVLNAC